MDPTDFLSPQVIAPTAGLVGVLVGAAISSRTTRSTHRERLAADQALAERKIEADIALAERKFEFDQRLAERKVDLDLALAEKKLALDRALAGWKRKTQFAEEALADFYHARDIIQGARSPASFSDEGETRPKAAWETEEDTRRLNSHFAIAERLGKKADFFAQLHARRYRFLTLFGKEEAADFDEIFKIRHEIIVAVQMLVWTYQERSEGSLPQNRRAWERVIWDTGADDDPIAGRLARAVADIEAICRPVIQASAP